MCWRSTFTVLTFLRRRWPLVRWSTTDLLDLLTVRQHLIYLHGEGRRPITFGLIFAYKAISKAANFRIVESSAAASRTAIMPSIRKLSKNQLVNEPVILPTISYNPLPNISKRLLTTTPCNSKMSSLEETKAIWRLADAVCFDVDSTVCEDEAIDELAKFCGKEKEIGQITKNAMSGKMDFRSALRTRLNIIKPTFQQVQSYMQTHPPKLTLGIRELISTLHQRDVPIYLVSGGFQSIILEVAKELKIPAENVFANKLKFFFDGAYAGFDEDEPVSRSGGKAEVVKKLKETHEYGNIVMIGDGATDLHTCPPADAFIGFGGNQVRDEVKRHAKWFVMDFKELLQELNSISSSGKSK